MTQHSPPEALGLVREPEQINNSLKVTHTLLARGVLAGSEAPEESSFIVKHRLFTRILPKPIS